MTLNRTARKLDGGFLKDCFVTYMKIRGELRLFSPEGFYPEGCYVLGSSLFYASENVVFSVASRQRPFAEVGLYTEVDRLSISEIRLIAPFHLATPLDEGSVTFKPFDSFPLLEIPRDVSLTRASVEATIFQLVRSRRMEFSRSGVQIEDLKYSKAILKDLKYSKARLRDLYQKLKPATPLLIRGLERLITSHELSSLNFMEEAATAAYVSMECGVQFVKQQLAKITRKAVKFESVYDFVDSLGHLYGHFRLGVTLQELYDDRIRVLHPYSRFGVFEYAPISADDCYDCMEACTALHNIAVDLSAITNQRGLRSLINLAATTKDAAYAKMEREVASMFRV